MTEAVTLQAIRLALGTTPGLRLFRNNVGAMRDPTGRLVTFGLCKGSSDLIGWRSVTVTPDMIGQRIAIFTALEIKAPGGTHRVTAEQHTFLRVVEEAGGLAGVARSPDQARLALGLLPMEGQP